MKIKIKKLHANELLFYLAYGIYLVVGILRLSMFGKYFTGNFNRMIMLSILLILVAREFYVNKMTKKSVLSCFICLILFLIVNNFGSAMFALTFVLVWSARNLKFKDIAKFSLIISSIMLVFIILCSNLGVITDYVVTRKGRIRHYLGFRYALYGPAILYNIYAIYIYLKNKKLKIILVVFLFILNYHIYQLTNSRLSFYLSIIVLLFGIFLKYKPDFFERKKLLCFLMISSFILCSLVSIILPMKYNSSISWMANLNSFLGSRLRLSKESLELYGVPLLGQKVSWYGWGVDMEGNVAQQVIKGNYNYVDNGYLSILQRYGVIVFVILIISLTYAMIRCYKKKNYYLLVLLTLIALHALIDDLIIYLFYNTLWFAITSNIDDFINEL